MSFFDKSERFDGENFQVDTTVKQKVVETHEFLIRDTYDDYPDYCKTFMDSNGQLRASTSGSNVVLCENKRQLKKFISWLIIAYKDIFND